jgi:hypothetical protein
MGRLGDIGNDALFRAGMPEPWTLDTAEPPDLEAQQAKSVGRPK